MYLEKLKIHNFRRFEDLEICFQPNMTVVVGANGVGKTTVLEAAAFAVGTFFSPFGSLASIGFNSEDPRQILFQKGSVSDAQKQFPVEAEAWGCVDRKEIKWKRVLNSEKGRTTIKEASQIIDIGKDYQKRLQKGDESLILPLIAYYGTGRLWDYHKDKSSNIFKSNTRTNGYLNCLDGTANVKLMMNWFSKMTITQYQRRESGEGETPELDVVYGAMAACLKSATNFDNIRFQYNMSSRELDVLYTENGERKKLPLALMSDGYKSTISLVADIAYRMTVLNPDLESRVLKETDGIVLIDEVDLHLHPAWQQKILYDLQNIFPKIQFIVSTHAPAVINTTKRENIRIIRGSVAEPPAVETYGRDANGILTSVMEAKHRPVDTLESFQSFYDALDGGEMDVAGSILDDLEEIYSDDPEVTSMRVQLDLEKI